MCRCLCHHALVTPSVFGLQHGLIRSADQVFVVGVGRDGRGDVANADRELRGAVAGDMQSQITNGLQHALGQFLCGLRIRLGQDRHKLLATPAANKVTRTLANAGQRLSHGLQRHVTAFVAVAFVEQPEMVNVDEQQRQRGLLALGVAQ